MGSLIKPHIEGVDEHYLSSGTVERFELSRAELAQFLSLEEVPIVIENELCWSSETDVWSL
jgi:hypothetical protein